MSYVERKPVFGVSDQVQHKPGCTASGDYKRLEILDFESRVSALSMYPKLISCVVTAQLICALVLAYAKSRFFHDAA